MDTHGVHQRHSALRKKRFRPSRLPGLHDFGLESDANSGASRVVDRQPLEGRQFSIPGFTLPLTDLCEYSSMGKHDNPSAVTLHCE